MSLVLIAVVQSCEERLIEGSFAPMLGILVQRDIKVFMGYSLVSITWPETSIQAQNCRYIPTGSRGIVKVVSFLLSHAQSWHLLELVPRDLFWQFLLREGRRSGQVCGTSQLHWDCPEQLLQHTKHLPLEYSKKCDCSGNLLPFCHAAHPFSGEADWTTSCPKWPLYIEVQENAGICHITNGNVHKQGIF